MSGFYAHVTHWEGTVRVRGSGQEEGRQDGVTHSERSYRGLQLEHARHSDPEPPERRRRRRAIAWGVSGCPRAHALGLMLFGAFGADCPIKVTNRCRRFPDHLPFLLHLQSFIQRAPGILYCGRAMQTILIVDDDDAVTEGLGETLQAKVVS